MAEPDIPEAADSLGASIKPPMLTVDQACRLDVDTTLETYRQHINPSQLRAWKLLGFDRVVIDSAEDVYYVDRSGRRILDFFGGFGAVALGHNHPRIVAARERFQRQRRHEIGFAFASQYVAALAANLCAVAPSGLDRVLLGCTGSEAVEGAVKLAQHAQGRRRKAVAYARNSFHGKTIGALSVTDSRLYRSRFSMPTPRYRVPFGDVSALEATLRAHREIGVLILETIQGGAGIVLPPPDYLRGVREVCDRYGVVWIADEVQSGVGRTGLFLACEHFGAVPDIVTLAKSLGGGKTAISAVLARTSVHDRAFGGSRTALIHGPGTFSGMGEACCTAIETLHVLYDENLMSAAVEQGGYLLAELEKLRQRHPRFIRRVRGRGLMVALELHDVSDCVSGVAGSLLGMFDKPLRGGLAALVGSVLLAEFGVLVAFTDYNRNVLRLEPPLTLRGHHVDTLVNALDSLLSRGAGGLVASYLRSVRRQSR